MLCGSAEGQYKELILKVLEGMLSQAGQWANREISMAGSGHHLRATRTGVEMALPEPRSQDHPVGAGIPEEMPSEADRKSEREIPWISLFSLPGSHHYLPLARPNQKSVDELFQEIEFLGSVPHSTNQRKGTAESESNQQSAGVKVQAISRCNLRTH